MLPIDVALIGRNRGAVSARTRSGTGRMRVVALAEPVEARRLAVAAEHGLAPERVFADWRALVAARPKAHAAIVATGDTEHVEPALAALAAGYHLLLEKPIAPVASDCVRVAEAAERARRILQIGHVLRYGVLRRYTSSCRAGASAVSR
jgi:predicted dehydrogenase